MIESELFGYEKGAFTGAEKFKPGKVQLADRGTLFLDEVTEMSALAQAKILRLLQEHEFEPLGSVKTRRADLRIIAATNKNLDQLVEDGKFRDDLYYRLFVYPINIPPLRERREDLPILVEYFIRKLNKAMGKQVQGLTQKAMAALKRYPWPGNIRELQNVVERFMILAKNNPIDVMDLPIYLLEETHLSPTRDALLSIPAGLTLKKHVRQVESKAILKTLKECASRHDTLHFPLQTFKNLPKLLNHPRSKA
ncbi:MAG: sigma 54-interacting transcriptional regulator [Nitrospinales bacterium]